MTAKEPASQRARFSADRCCWTAAATASSVADGHVNLRADKRIRGHPTRQPHGSDSGSGFEQRTHHQQQHDDPWSSTRSGTNVRHCGGRTATLLGRAGRRQRARAVAAGGRDASWPTGLRSMGARGHGRPDANATRVFHGSKRSAAIQQIIQLYSCIKRYTARTPCPAPTV